MLGRDKDSLDAGKRTAYWRHRYASPDEPNIFTDKCVTLDPTGAEISKEVELPERLVRQQWLAQDPLASVRYYVVIMRVVLPAAFGARACFHCPDCDADGDARREHRESCSDFSGNNRKSMGGYVGIATAAAFANEFQGAWFPKSGTMT